MLQCCVCEDWFHSRVSDGMAICPHYVKYFITQHLGTCPPDDEQYDEMVCDSCASHWPFLEVYSIHVWPSRVTKAAEKEDISLEVTGKEETHECLVARWKMVQDASQRPPLKTLYFSEGWRKRICKCPSCLVGKSMCRCHDTLMCSTLQERCCDADFLLDEEDSISAYERRGVAKGPPLDTHDAGMAAMLSTFDHTQQVEMLHGESVMFISHGNCYLVTGYATMKENLVDFLKGFSDSGKVMIPSYCVGF